MPLITLIVTLVVIGVVLWAINTYVPMEAGMKKLLNIAVIIICVLWILSQMGVLGSMNNVRVGH